MHLAWRSARAPMPAAAAWAEVTRIEHELGQARAAAADAARDRDWLAHASAEIEALAPEAGEETRLAEERSAMQSGAKAGEALAGLDELLGGSDGALAKLRLAARRIGRGAADHPLAADALAFDPARLETVEARLFEIRALARKHRVEADALNALGEQMRGQLALIEQGGERIAQLDADLVAAREAYSRAADVLSKARHAAARTLDSAMSAELAPLKLDAARFRTAIAPAEPGPAGTDRVEFEVSTNPGAPFGPLTRIASG